MGNIMDRQYILDKALCEVDDKWLITAANIKSVGNLKHHRIKLK
jgi:hypothetical protein